MGSNHTDRLADGDRVPGGRPTYRQLLDAGKAKAAARAAAPAASTWSRAVAVLTAWPRRAAR